MPFSIELLKEKPYVKLQVNKNVITVYSYGGSDKEVGLLLDQWEKVDSLFLDSMPEWNADWFRGSDAAHLKRSHTNAAEVKQDHFHIEFTREVTPELLARYLNAFEKKSNFIGFEFFKKGEIGSIEKDDSDSILSKFSAYYKIHKGSLTETLFNQETTLTPDEKKSYEREYQEYKKQPSALAMLSVFAAVDESEASSATSSLGYASLCSIL